MADVVDGHVARDHTRQDQAPPLSRRERNLRRQVAQRTEQSYDYDFHLVSKQWFIMSYHWLIKLASYVRSLVDDDPLFTHSWCTFRYTFVIGFGVPLFIITLLYSLVVLRLRNTGKAYKEYAQITHFTKKFHSLRVYAYPYSIFCNRKEYIPGTCYSYLLQLVHHSEVTVRTKKSQTYMICLLHHNFWTNRASKSRFLWRWSSWNWALFLKRLLSE